MNPRMARQRWLWLIRCRFSHSTAQSGADCHKSGKIRKAWENEVARKDCDAR